MIFSIPIRENLIYSYLILSILVFKKHENAVLTVHQTNER